MKKNNKKETVPLPTPELIRVTYEIMRQQKPSLHLTLRNIYLRINQSKSFREITQCLDDVNPVVETIVRQLKKYQTQSLAVSQDWVKDALIDVLINKWEDIKPINQITAPCGELIIPNNKSIVAL